MPKPPFISLVVEQGGIGEGTVIVFQMQLMGRTQTFRAEVAEPKPGRVLVETNESGTVTTFTVEPSDDGQHAHVTIATDSEVRDGVLGAVSGWFTKRLLHPIYERELELLENIAMERAEQGP